MDADAVDRQYSALQQQAQQTAGLIQALAGKLSAAAGAGDPNAREWQLDLKEIALAIRDEENVATSLLQAIHSLVDDHVQNPVPAMPPQYQPPAAYPAPPAYPQSPGYAQPQYAAYPQPQGALQRFLGGSFGRAIATGAGFGIGDDIVNSIFGGL
jgi:hypothetical protein